MHTQASPRMSVHPLVYSLSFAEEVVQPRCVQTKRGGLFLKQILLLTSARFIDRTDVRLMSDTVRFRLIYQVP